MGFERLQERVVDWRVNDVVVDVEDRVVRNVAFAGSDSRNGYRYSEEALREAVELYRDKPVFLDHAEHPQKPRDRSTRDLVGTIVECRYEADRIRGDIRVLDTESGKTFFALAEMETPGVGMSHVVMARRSSDGSIVESIEDVVSVDVVVFPATTTTLKESVDSGEEIESELSELDSGCLLRAERDWWRNKAEGSEQELQSFHESVRETDSVRGLIAKSGLPEFAVTDLFESVLVGLESDAARWELIRDRIEVIQKGSRIFPESCKRIEERGFDENRFLSVLTKGRRKQVRSLSD